MHVAESTHWYDRTGKPCYTQKAKAGHDRPTTLADARKLGLVPSVTTIINCCAKPGLERWKLDQMMHAALTLPRESQEAEARWIDRVWADSRETASKAATRGTAVHAAIQGSYEGNPPGPEYFPHVLAAENAVENWYPGAIWTAEDSFSNQLGFGGKVDLNSGIGAVVDFKTKEFTAEERLKTWDEHAMQLAAYRKGLGMYQAKCAIVYVSVTEPGLARLIEISSKELEAGWKMFSALLEYWKAKNGFESGWQLEAA